MDATSAKDEGTTSTGKDEPPSYSKSQETSQEQAPRKPPAQIKRSVLVSFQAGKVRYMDGKTGCIMSTPSSWGGSPTVSEYTRISADLSFSALRNRLLARVEELRLFSRPINPETEQLRDVVQVRTGGEFTGIVTNIGPTTWPATRDALMQRNDMIIKFIPVRVNNAWLAKQNAKREKSKARQTDGSQCVLQ